jgi:hypothetical protein
VRPNEGRRAAGFDDSVFGLAASSAADNKSTLGRWPPKWKGEWEEVEEEVVRVRGIEGDARKEWTCVDAITTLTLGLSYI